MKTIKYLTLALCCIALFTTCKKYPEGGRIKKGPKNIIGKWNLTLYEVDGIDSTSFISVNTTYDAKQVTITTACSSCEIHIHPLGGVVYGVNFISSNNVITGRGESYHGAFPCYVDGCSKEYFLPEGISASWNILKLDNEEMHLEMQGIHSYKLKLDKL